MNHDANLKQRAIALRKAGKTYREILAAVPVAKSTLSLWFKDVGLSQKQQHTLTKRRQAAQQRGADKRRENRLHATDEIYQNCQQDIRELTERERFLLGIALYWAEGCKHSGERVSIPVEFANSDPDMVALFVHWLKEHTLIDPKDIFIRLHLHQSHREREDKIKRLWARKIHIPLAQFSRTLYKSHTAKTNRTNVGDEYIGLVSVRVRRSTELNRRIMGWIHAIISAQNI